RQVSTIYNALNQYRGEMEAAPQVAQGPEALDHLFVVVGGKRIPLSAFSRYEHTTAPDRIHHTRQLAPVTREVAFAPGVSRWQEGGGVAGRSVGGPRAGCRERPAWSSRRRAIRPWRSSARC